MIAIDVTSAAAAVPAIIEAASTGRILLFQLENMFISPIFFDAPVLSKERTGYGCGYRVILESFVLRLFLPLFAAASFRCIAGSLAGETIDLENLDRIPTEIRNSGASAILCQAEIAHWFATDLAAIEPGGTAVLDLRFEATTGTWAVINAAGEALPLERAWCGVEGRTYETRWTLVLERELPEPARLDCQVQDSSLDCR